MATPSLPVLFLITWICLHGTYAEDGQDFCRKVCSCLGNNVLCESAGVTHIPPDLPSWVDKLILSRNNITHLNATSLSNKIHLKTLELKHNELSEMPEGDALPPNLENLDLSYNSITELYGNYSSLRELDVSHNKITDIPLNTFPQDNAFSQINLSSNRIVVITPGTLDDLVHLKHLKLSKNRLLAIPKDLFKQLKSLQVLDLNRNRLRNIGGLAFQGLGNLKALRLKKNSISNLDDGAFFRLSSIQVLQLSHNNVSTVSKGWLYGLNSLLELNLANNRVSAITRGAWEFCSKLKELDLRHNAITSVDRDMFRQLPNLKYLFLQHNKISYIEEGAFKDLKELSLLVLDHNDISWAVEDTSGIFGGLNNLMSLSLRGNHISSVATDAFVGLSGLEKLDLSGNNIASVHEGAFEKLEELDDLVMNTSTLLCDCKLAWFPKWIREYNMGNLEAANMSCIYPPQLRNTSIMNLQDSQFVCTEGAASPRPLLVEEPKSRIRLQGENMTLMCVARSSEAQELRFQWKKDNLPMEHANVTNHFQENDHGVRFQSELSLYNLSEADAGRYQCVVSNIVGKSYSSRANITIYEYPEFSKIPRDLEVQAGESAKFECSAHGSPPPRISWTKIGLTEEFPAARERRLHVMSPTDYEFYIANVKVEDMGVYRCSAENPAGSISANVTLTVQEPPYFERPMEDKEVVLEETVVLECSRMGSPQPQLKWRKDNQELDITERHFFTSNDQLLVIVKVKPSDAGLYECEISNSLGVKTESAKLTVIPAKTSGHSTTEMIMIAVVCCVLGTSIVWVCVIYQARRRRASRAARKAALSCPEAACQQTAGMFFMDNTSEHSSKDSGTGDSAKRSNDDLIIADSHLCSESLGSLHHDDSINSLERVSGGLQTFQQPPPPPRQDWRLTCNPAHDEGHALLTDIPADQI